MELALMKWALVVWLGLFALAFANGAFRELVLKKRMAEPKARSLSALTAVLLFTACVAFAWPRAPIESTAEAISVGIVWLFLTVLAETILLGRWMMKQSWNQILKNYDVSQGELWPAVLLWITLLPVLTFWWRGAL